jgi:hypothetical protein
MKELMIFDWMRVPFLFLLCSFPTVLVGAQPSAHEETSVSRFQEQKFKFQLGFFYPKITTKVQLDSNIGDRGTVIDMESDLGLEERKGLAQAEFSMAFAKKWRWGIDYFELDRRSTSRAQKTLSWGENSIDIDALVDTFFNSTIWRIYASYEFKNAPTWNCGGTFGLHAFDLEAGLGLVPTNPLLATEYTTAETVLLPLPNIGFFWNWQAHPNWILNARADFFSLKIDEYSGSLVSMETSVRYLLNDHVAAGVSMTYFNQKLSINKSQWSGSYSFGYWGPKIFVSTHW